MGAFYMSYLWYIISYEFKSKRTRVPSHWSKRFRVRTMWKKFLRPPHLKKHVREVHEGRKDHICTYCAKSFKNKEALKRHSSIIHEGIKRFKCEICKNLAYGQSHELKKHYLNVHKE